MQKLLLFTFFAFLLSLEILPNEKIYIRMTNNYQTATFGGGCFWCTEAVFKELKGVKTVTSGYAGGFIKNPSYREVCNGTTGHAEVIQITFDPDEISYSEILNIFFSTHDPTTLNRQGGDVGTQYRSVIFYHDPHQKETAEKKIKELTSGGKFKDPVVTSVDKFTNFYKAEEYHQDYFAKNPDQAYCSVVVKPKVDKFMKNFSDMLK